MNSSSDKPRGDTDLDTASPHGVREHQTTRTVIVRI
jgi:hypothetical protein